MKYTSEQPCYNYCDGAMHNEKFYHNSKSTCNYTAKAPPAADWHFIYIHAHRVREHTQVGMDNVTLAASTFKIHITIYVWIWVHNRDEGANAIWTVQCSLQQPKHNV